MRNIWSGTLQFGLVRIPVGLTPTARAADVEFKTLHRECGTPVKQQRWCPFHEKAVEAEELVKGWQIAPGEYVLVEEDELAALDSEASTRAIETLGFIDAGDVAAIAVERCYYLAPSESPIGRRPYALLSDALGQTGRAGVVRFVAWGKERIALIRPADEECTTLLLQTLRYQTELVPTDELEQLLADVEISDAEIKLAKQLMRKLGDVDLATLEDRYQPLVRRLLEDKIAGKKIVRAPAPEHAESEAPTVDLAAALRKSVKAARQS